MEGIVKPLDIKAVINECFKDDKKAIIVEDDEDKKRYTDIVFNNQRNYKFISSRKFKNGTGCNAVIKLFESNIEYMKKFGGYNYVKGLIDCDLWPFRKDNEERNIKLERLKECLIVLDRYCIESYFFDKETLESIFLSYINATKDEFDRIMLEHIWNQISKKVLNDAFDIAVLRLLYYQFGIKTEFFGIKPDSPKIIYRENRENIIIKEKEKYSKEFADVIRIYSLSKDWETIRKILNGKDLNFIISSEILKCINELSNNKCAKDVFNEIVCTEYEKDCKCIFKPKSGLGKSLSLDHNTIYDKIGEKCDLNQIQLLKNEIIKKFD